MAKIDFVKVEQSLGEAMYHLFVKKLVKGETAGHARAIAYFGQQRSKPSPQDPVIQTLEDIQLEEIEEEQVLNTPETEEPLPEPVSEVSIEEPAPIFIPPPEEPAIPDEIRASISPIFILRNRIRWFIRKKLVDIYKLLGTTKEEVSALRRKKELSPGDLERINELIEKSREITQSINKKLGAENDEMLIDVEKKKHLTKRFNVRETWLPL